MRASLKAVAYHLGQFHPTAENDAFWGPGFTEWHNVAKARRLYPGHRQPKLPGKLGFYDLRSPDALVEQIAYSHELGIDAFCHWHYWFAGRRLLHKPLDTMLQLGYPGYQFMLGWANESWSGIWHGTPDKTLIEQRYDRQELVEHAKLISRYIETGRYLSLNGLRPFVVYKPLQIPKATEYLSELKEEVYRLSKNELYIIGNWSPTRRGSFVNPASHGLDAAVITPLPTRCAGALGHLFYAAFRNAARKFGIGPEISRYRGIVPTLYKARDIIQGRSHATIVTGWDNTPRSGRRGLVLSGYSGRSLRQAAIAAVKLELNNDVPLLFIKSWNEWAEGNVLEPLFDENWSAGTVVKSVLQSYRNGLSTESVYAAQHA